MGQQPKTRALSMTVFNHDFDDDYDAAGPDRFTVSYQCVEIRCLKLGLALERCVSSCVPQSSGNYAEYAPSPFFHHAVTAQTDNQDSFCQSRLPLHWTFCLKFSHDTCLLAVFKSRLKTFLFRQTCTPT